MRIRILILILFTALVGCTTLSPEAPVAEAPTAPAVIPTRQPNPVQVQTSIGNCANLHQAFGTGQSPVDCWYEFPRMMVLSFPSSGFHNKHLSIVRQYHGDWCRGVTEMTGYAPNFVRIFRRDGITRSQKCEQSTIQSFFQGGSDELQGRSEHDNGNVPGKSEGDDSPQANPE